MYIKLSSKGQINEMHRQMHFSHLTINDGIGKFELNFLLLHKSRIDPIKNRSDKDTIRIVMPYTIAFRFY